MANEAKQFTIGGVTHDVMDVGARQAIASLQNAIDAITSGDTTTAIKTFQEVIDFLDGVTDDATLIGKLNELRTLIAAKYSKPANGIPASDLADGVIPDVSGFATKTEVNAKANDNAVVKSISVNGTAQTKDGNGNVNVSVPTLTLDDAPTAGSNNAVKSGGIKTALDNLLANLRIVNGEWYIGNTATGVSAQGPAGNVNITDASQLVTILVNDLTTGGAGNILSAEMGKVLKTAVSTLIDSMGEYCFPNGRPTLSWKGAKADIITNFNNSHVASSNTAQRVDIGASFETTLGTDDNLHVIDDDSVVVKMGGVTQAGAYTAATGKVTIAEVTDYIEITANAITYVQNGLVSMFDGMNRGDVTGEWADVKDGTRKLILTQCTEASDHVEFDGTNSKALASSTSVGVDVPRAQGTIELVATGVICNSTKTAGQLISNHCYKQNGSVVPLMMVTLLYSASFSNGVGVGFTQKDPSEQDASIPYPWLLGKSQLSASDKLHLSLSDSRAYLNGTGLVRASARTYSSVADNAKLGIFSYINRTTGEEGTNAQGSVYCARIYDTKLTADEVAQNYKVDRKRFNLI